jgi:ubiquitin-like modifier-activating enzyme 5
MGVTSGLLVQNALKYMLKFGVVSDYLGYNALSDFFPQYTMRPNPTCDNADCCTSQAEYQVVASPWHFDLSILNDTE